MKIIFISSKIKIPVKIVICATYEYAESKIDQKIVAFVTHRKLNILTYIDNILYLMNNW